MKTKFVEKIKDGEREMKKLISFKKLKSICVFEYYNDYLKISECDHYKAMSKKCCLKNCPIWKELKNET